MFGVMLLSFAMLFHYTATVMEPSLSLAHWHTGTGMGGRGGPDSVCHCSALSESHHSVMISMASTQWNVCDM